MDGPSQEGSLSLGLTSPMSMDRGRFTRVEVWPKIVSHFHATGVCFGSEAAAGESMLSVCSGDMTTDA
jgi:hypothetical protein